MTPLNELIEDVKKLKIKFIESQRYGTAASLRDIEKQLYEYSEFICDAPIDSFPCQKYGVSDGCDDCPFKKHK